MSVPSLLLIEPVWNWNFVVEVLNCFSVLLLIEPVWNWNLERFAFLQGSSHPSNRTSLELKLISRFRLIHDLCPSNRTSLELKLRYRFCPLLIQTSNRTSLELKQARGPRRSLSRYASNRTSLELKPYLCALSSAIHLFFLHPFFHWNQWLPQES